jgi:glycine/D-amino acid oxidase-like deaminating enzyme
VSADRVVLATNVFPSLLGRNRLMTVPVYDYVLMTEPLTSEQMQSIGWAGREGLSDMANQLNYSRLTADNRILFGGCDAVYHVGRKVRARLVRVRDLVRSHGGDKDGDPAKSTDDGEAAHGFLDFIEVLST